MESGGFNYLVIIIISTCKVADSAIFDCYWWVESRGLGVEECPYDWWVGVGR